MKTILLFGAGKSATVLIKYLVENGPVYNWRLIAADANKQLAQSKLNASERDIAVQLDVHNSEKRRELIQASDLVISLLPPTLHYLVALDCLQYKKHLLTASYIDDQIERLREEVKKKQSPVFM